MPAPRPTVNVESALISYDTLNASPSLALSGPLQSRTATGSAGGVEDAPPPGVGWALTPIHAALISPRYAIPAATRGTMIPTTMIAQINQRQGNFFFAGGGGASPESPTASSSATDMSASLSRT